MIGGGGPARVRSLRRSTGAVVLAGMAGACALLALEACVTTLSYQYDGGTDGGRDATVSSETSTGADASPDAQASRPCSRMVLAGGNRPGGGPTSSVFLGKVNGTDVTWSLSTTTLPFETSEAAALALGSGRVLVAGGAPMYTGAAVLPRAEGASWETVSPLPSNGAGCTAGSLAPGELHVICDQGGAIDGGAPNAFLGRFDDTLRTWEVARPPDRLTTGGVAVALEGLDRWLAIGADGLAQIGTPPPTARNKIMWVDATNLSKPRANACMVANGDRVYVIGGVGSMEVTLGRIAADGSLSWPPSPTLAPLPDARARASCLVANGRIWVVAGERSSNDYVDTVYSAGIVGEGLDSWTKAPSALPVRLANAALACLP